MTVLTVNDDQDIAVVTSEYMRLRYKNGTEWYTVEGITDYSVSNASTPKREIIPAAGHIKTRLSRVRPGEVTFQSYFIPNDRHWRFLQDAATNGDVVQFQIQTDGDRIFTSDTTNGANVSVGSDGEVEFTKQGSGQDFPTVASYPFGVGSVIHVSSTVNFVVDEVETDGTVHAVEYPSYAHPSTDSTAARFGIYSPAPQQYAFNGYVTNIFEASLNSEGELMTPLTITLRAPFPKPTILTDLLNLT